MARTIRLGVIGLGRAFTLMLPTFVADSRITLAGAVDPRPEARRRFESDFEVRTHETIDPLCADPTLDAIYVASPHQFHCEHATAAARAGKHVLVEKPMALSLADGRTMIDAATRAGVFLIVGHSHSFDLPIRRTRELIASGEYGRLRMITAMNFTDFIYRPRRPEELDTRAGGGVVLGQAVHQIDVVRLLAGGRLRALRAQTDAWDPVRPIEGAYSALLEFDDGTFASLTYSGYAHFDTDEFCDGIGEMGVPTNGADYGMARRRLAAMGSSDEETRIKAARGFGGTDEPSSASPAPHHQHFGLVIASCERADLRPTPDGVTIYADFERRHEPLPPPIVPRREVIDELYDAVVERRRPIHDGEWGLATLEASLALLQAARERREIVLQHQVALR
jgi:phthalate 4,5-cis-dihydrodiol dehydrogenase